MNVLKKISDDYDFQLGETLTSFQQIEEIIKTLFGVEGNFKFDPSNHQKHQMEKILIALLEPLLAELRLTEYKISRINALLIDRELKVSSTKISFEKKNTTT